MHLLLLAAVFLGCSDDRIDEQPPVGREDPAWPFDDVEAAAPPPGVGACAPGVAAFSGARTWTSIADAWALAPARAIIWVCPGQYAAPPLVRAAGWPITLAGATGDPADVVMESPIGDRMFHLPFAARVRLHALTFAAVDSPGLDTQILSAPAAGAVDIEDCVIDGGGHTNVLLVAVSDGGALRLTDSVVRGADIEGVGGVQWGSDRRPMYVWIRGTTFEDNHAHGAVDVNSRSSRYPVYLRVEDSAFRGNTAITEGAAIAGSAQRMYAEIRRTVFEDNETLPSPGQLTATGGPVTFQVPGEVPVQGIVGGVLRLTMEDCLFQDNRSAGPASAIRFAGDTTLFPHDVEVDMINSTFVRNDCVGYRYPRASYGAIYPGAGTIIHFTDVDFGLGADENDPGDITNYHYNGMHLGPAQTFTFTY